jgi:hypothetical protein
MPTCAAHHRAQYGAGVESIDVKSIGKLAGSFMVLAITLGRAQPVSLNVEFKLTDLEYKPLPGQPVRLVFGAGKDWQGPNAGNRFVTDANGQAIFATQVVLERRWTSVPVGFTGLSKPTRADHLQIAAELERLLPGINAGKDLTLHQLYKMDIDVLPGGDCATSDFTDVYLPDSQGRFTKAVPREGMAVPNSGGLILSGMGYQTWDHQLLPVDDAKTQWKLKLAFKRSPPPVRR